MRVAQGGSVVGDCSGKGLPALNDLVGGLRRRRRDGVALVSARQELGLCGDERDVRDVERPLDHGEDRQLRRAHQLTGSR